MQGIFTLFPAALRQMRFSPLRCWVLPGDSAGFPVSGIRLTMYGERLHQRRSGTTCPTREHRILNTLGKIAVILVPLLLIFIYRRYGQEKAVVVPAYLSTIPGTNLKPWQVNLLFKGDAQDFDEDGYYATLLDLHRRKNIAIAEKPDGKGVTVAILSDAGLDPYEQRVLTFLRLVSKDGVLDTGYIEELAKKARVNRTAEEAALRYQRSLTDVTSRADSSLAGQYIVDGRDHILPLGFTSIVLFAVSLIWFFVAPMQAYILAPAAVLWGVATLQAGIAFAAPSTLFGHWKDDRYQGETGMGCLHTFPLRYGNDPEVCPRRHPDVGRMARIRHSPRGRG